MGKLEKIEALGFKGQQIFWNNPDKADHPFWNGPFTMLIALSSVVLFGAYFFRKMRTRDLQQSIEDFEQGSGD